MIVPCPLNGLSLHPKRREIEVTSGRRAVQQSYDADVTDEFKVRTYLENKQRLAQDRASGRYRDDQGRVTR